MIPKPAGSRPCGLLALSAALAEFNPAIGGWEVMYPQERSRVVGSPIASVILRTDSEAVSSSVLARKPRGAVPAMPTAESTRAAGNPTYMNPQMI